jgi:hypothetical protein
MTAEDREIVFISYSHKDKRWLSDLQTHLKPYLREESVVAWSDQQIQPGTKWFPEIQRSLQKARLAVLLVTPSFLASDFINDYELAPLLLEAERGGVTILWIPVRACAYQRHSIGEYQSVIDPAKPLAQMKAERDAAWVKICEAIAETAGNDPILLPVRSSLSNDLRMAIARGELQSSLCAPLVTAALAGEADINLADDYNPSVLVAGIRASDAISPRIASNAGSRDWQADVAEVCVPSIIAVVKSLNRSPGALKTMVRVCDSIAKEFEACFDWPDAGPLFDSRVNAIYEACFNATELESDDVLVRLREVRVNLLR